MRKDVRRSVQVSPDVKLLNSGEMDEVSAGHLRAVPPSYSHPFVTMFSKAQQWGAAEMATMSGL